MNGRGAVKFAKPQEDNGSFLDGLRRKKCFKPFSKFVQIVEGDFVDDKLEVTSHFKSSIKCTYILRQER